jgi:hypothetical protein
MKQLPEFAEFGVLLLDQQLEFWFSRSQFLKSFGWRTSVLRSGLADHRIADRSDAATIVNAIWATGRRALVQPHLVERFNTTNGAKHHLSCIQGPCAQDGKG